jgi:gamma-glutamyl phosphate reductase
LELRDGQLTRKRVANLNSAIALFDRYSQQFPVALISENAEAHERFDNTTNAPFVCNGITRWLSSRSLHQSIVVSKTVNIFEGSRKPEVCDRSVSQK